MRILATADIHLGYDRATRGAENFLKKLADVKNIDVILVAGDIAENGAESTDEICKHHRKAFEHLRNTGCRNIAIIAGSHDIWTFGENPDSWQILMEYLYNLAGEFGITYLERQNLYVDDIAFAGTMGHYDYSMADPGLIINGIVISSKHYRKNIPPGYDEPWWGDAGRIRWEYDDPQACRIILDAFNQRLKEACEKSEKVIILSHTVPIQDLNGHIFSLNNPKSRFRSAYSGTKALNSLILENNPEGKIKEVISGHTHLKVGPITKDGIRYRNIGGDYGKPVYQIIEIQK
jgi:Icc-related predicted phosphoesterase